MTLLADKCLDTLHCHDEENGYRKRLYKKRVSVQEQTFLLNTKSHLKFFLNLKSDCKNSLGDQSKN